MIIKMNKQKKMNRKKSKIALLSEDQEPKDFKVPLKRPYKMAQLVKHPVKKDLTLITTYFYQVKVLKQAEMAPQRSL